MKCTGCSQNSILFCFVLLFCKSRCKLRSPIFRQSNMSTSYNYLISIVNSISQHVYKFIQIPWLSQRQAFGWVSHRRSYVDFILLIGRHWKSRYGSFLESRNKVRRNELTNLIYLVRSAEKHKCSLLKSWLVKPVVVAARPYSLLLF